MKKPYNYKGCDGDNSFDLQCIDGQRLEGCLGFDCYFDLICYILQLFKGGIVDIEDNKKLQKIEMTRDFIEEEVDKIRQGKTSILGEYVDVIDCENVAGIPSQYDNVGYFLY